MQGSRTPITSPNNTRNNRGRVVLPSVEQDVVMSDHNKVETVPRRGGQVRAKILPDRGPKVGTQQGVDVSGERFDIQGTKKEELLALTHDILKKQHTVSLGELMKLIPQLPRTLSQEVQGPPVARETGSEVLEENPPGKMVSSALIGIRESDLPASLEHSPLGEPHGQLIRIPARVGGARMMAVINSGAMLDVISKRMFVALGC